MTRRALFNLFLGLVFASALGTGPLACKGGSSSRKPPTPGPAEPGPDPVLLSIAVSPAGPSTPVGSTQPFSATGAFDDGSSLDLTAQAAWTSSDPAVASISNDPGSAGVARALREGSSLISATVRGVVGSFTLVVTAPVPVAIELDPVNPSIAAGTVLAFAATGILPDGTTSDLTARATWTSSDPAVASVSNDPGAAGRATGRGEGTATITAALEGVSGSTTITVTDAVLVAIEVTPLNRSIAAGTTLAFAATGVFDDGTTQDLTLQAAWSSSDAAVASVESAPGAPGLATGRRRGSATITAALGDVSGSTTLTVTVAVLAAIEVAPAGATIARGTRQQFTATGRFEDGSRQDLTLQAMWSSSRARVAAVSNEARTRGLATALKPGRTSITAALNGVSGSTPLRVTLKPHTHGDDEPGDGDDGGDDDDDHDDHDDDD